MRHKQPGKTASAATKAFVTHANAVEAHLTESGDRLISMDVRKLHTMAAQTHATMAQAYAAILVAEATKTFATSSAPDIAPELEV